MRRLVLLVLLLSSAACAAKKTVPAPVVVVTPKFPDFVMPPVPAGWAASPTAVNHELGWRFLQAGDLKNAERAFMAALSGIPMFYPAEAALGYVALARQDAAAALDHFRRAVDWEPAYASAQVGSGEALLALGRDAEALAAFEAALSVDPSLGDLRPRVEVLRFRGVQENLVRARQDARAGRLDESIRAYTNAIAGSPDSAFLYRELGGVERQKGDSDRALEHFRKAVSLDATDAQSLAQIGELLESVNDFEGAIRAYSDALVLEPSERLEEKRDRARTLAALARLPEEYRAIDQAPQMTRADLAALIGIRLAPLLQANQRGDAGLVTDVRNHWASTWILAVAGAGVMEPFDNHTFQPRLVVRRADLAQAMSRLLLRVSGGAATQVKAWQAARLRFSNLPPSHLAYPAASVAVASGVMTVGSDNAFQPSRPVRGMEAVESIGRLEAIAGLDAAKARQGGR